MRRWMVLLVAMVGCKADVAAAPIVEPDDTGLGPLLESRVRVFATFRYDAATGLPGPWLDESSGQSTSAIDIVVADDEYDGLNGTYCRVLVPIGAREATPIGNLQDHQYWGVTLEVAPERVSTNCDEPGFERIWDFYDGQVVDFLATNRDGSPARFGVIVQEPTSEAVNWLAGAGPQIEADNVIGGAILLSDWWSAARVETIAGLAYQTDENGIVARDAEGSRRPISRAEVPQPTGIEEGRYDLSGYRFVVFRRPPP